MKNIIKQICVNSFVVILCVVTVLAVFGQTKSDKKREDFQNQQRVINLSFYKNNIKSLEDAPMRCFVRRQIVEFVFAKKVTTQYELAEDLAIACLEDYAKNPKQFNAGLRLILPNEMIFLLRNISLETSEKARVKYLFKKDDKNLIEFSEEELKQNPDALINKVRAKIQSGNLPSNILTIYFTIQRLKLETVPLLLDLILKHFERLAITQDYDPMFYSFSGNFMNKDVPVEIKRRYLQLAVRLAQKGLTQDKDSELSIKSFQLLSWTLPIMKEITPSIYPQAAAIYATLKGRLADDGQRFLEVYERIKKSEDKLGQTLIEAEAAEDEDLIEYLWTSAGRLAVKEKKFKLAVDCINKRASETDFDIGYKRQILKDEILSAALKENDFEAADYVVEIIDGNYSKGNSLLDIAFAHLKLKDETKALEKLNEALRVLEKAEDDIYKMLNLFSASRLATKIENADAFETANSAIKVVNRLSALAPEDLSETESRNQYVAKVLIPNAINIENTFGILAKKDVNFAYPISQGIQRKDLQLVAEIVIEMHKVYPYTPQKEKEVQK